MLPLKWIMVNLCRTKVGSSPNILTSVKLPENGEYNLMLQGVQCSPKLTIGNFR